MVHTRDSVNDVVQEYVDKTVSRVPEVHEIWLFGSQVTGNVQEDSDIDLAIVSPLFEKDFPRAMSTMYKTLWNMRTGTNIEIHGFTPEDFEQDLLGAEVRTTGIRMYPA